jgi:outer membrane receptor protein involved in Fe transport
MRVLGRSVLFLVFVPVFLLHVSPGAYAQSEAGGASVDGVVRDPHGAVVAQAHVSVTNEEGGWSREGTTTRAGLYAFLRLPPGTYTIAVTSAGFETFTRTGLELAVGSRATLDVVLSPAGVTESLTVSAPSQLVDTARTSVGANVKERAVRNLPINGRNFLDFTLLTPGVVRDPRLGDLSIAGQRGPANSVLVDGSDANSAFWGQSVGRAGFRNPYSFSMDAVQEFQVNSSSYAPELGRASGGVINVITKSGTNDLSGTGFWFFRDRSLNANTFFRNKAGLPKAPYRFNQFGGNLGGPVVRDRLFFFYNYDGQRNTAPNSVFFPVAPPTDPLSQAAVQELTPSLATYQTGLHNDIHTIKGDWIASPSHTVSGRYNRHRFLGSNWESPGSQSALSHTGNTVLNTDSVSLAHTWLFPHILLDQRFTYVDENNPSIVSADGPEVVVRQSGVTMLSFGRLNVLPRYTTQHKTGFTETMAWSAGRHTFKVGHDIKFERAHNFAPTLFYGSYTFNSLADFENRTPVSYSQAFGAPDTNGGLTFPDSNAIALFAQDSWRATDQLTLDYGIRYDYFSYAGNGVRNQDPGLASLGLTTGVMPRDPNDAAARIGFAFRPMRDKQMVLRGGFGTFYGMLPGLVARTIQAQNGIQIRTLTFTGSAMPVYPATFTQSPAMAGAAPDIYVMQPDFRSPRTHQWSASLDRTVGQAVAFSVGYVGARGVDLTRVRDVNLFPDEVISAHFADGTSVTFDRHPGTSAPLRPNTAFGRISVVESTASSTYHAAVLQTTIRSGHGLTLDASYTLSRAIDTAPEATMFIPNSSTSDVTYVQDPSHPDADRGFSEAHAGHRFVMSAVWDIRAGWQVSAITSAQSGHWFSARTNVDLNNDGNRFSDRPPGFGRNTVQGPAYASVDLRVAKSIPLRGRGQIRLIAEGFNVLNRANVSAIQQVAYTYDATTKIFTPSPTFRTPTDTSDPRILQIAARFTF